MVYGAQANNIIRANKALLKKNRTFKEMKGSYIGYVEDAALEFKQITRFQQKKIMDKIIAEAKKDRLQNLKIAIISWIIIGVLVFVTYLVFR